MVWILWAACADDTTPTSTSADTASTADAGDPQTSGMAWLVEVLDGAACPPATNGFLGGHLFDVGTSDCDADPCADGPERPSAVPMAADASALPTPAWMPPVLAKYCMYVPIEPTDEPPQFAPAAPAHLGPERARKVVVAQASAGDELEDYYVAQTAAQIALCPAIPAGTARLALLDTLRDGPWSASPVDAGAAHGQVLATGVHDLLCAAGGCGAVDVRYRSALPLRYETATRTVWSAGAGGTFGPLDWVAQAIVREVRSWQAGAAQGLVLNLSLGWNPAFGGTATGGDTIDVRAVYDALRYARCAGALPIAAIGNRVGGGLDDGPYYPAAWAATVLNGDTCLAEFAASGVPPAQPVPLVYAVGGVGADGAPIGLTRAASLPHLVAYAQNFETPGVRSLGLRGLTGSSVGAAVVSATAALAWAEDPSLSPDEVMQVVWQRGSDTLAAPEGLFAAASPPTTQAFVPYTGASHRVPWTAACIGSAPPAAPAWTACADDPSSCGPAAVGDPEAGDPFAGIPPTTGYAPYAAPTPGPHSCPPCAIDLQAKLLYVALDFAVVGEARLSTRAGGAWTTRALTNLATPSTSSVPWVAPGTDRAVLTYDVGGVGYMSEIRVF